MIMLTILSIASHAQNLVIDGSFEDTLACPIPNQGSQLAQNLLKHWNFSLKAGYFNSCETSTNGVNRWGVPQNLAGYELSHSGKGYIFICTYGSFQQANYRNYAVGNLSKKLDAGKKYRIKMYVSLADSFITACNNMAIYFSDTLPIYNVSGYLLNFNFTNNLPIQFHQNLSNKVGWTLLDTIFTASGYEKWLTIGNFKKDDESDTTFIGGNSIQTNFVWDYSAYYIDDVSVELVDETGLEEDGNAFGITILPNPNNGCFTIKADAFNKPTTFVITDALGQVIDIVTLTGSSTKYDNRNLPNGIYFYTTLSNNVVTSRGKFLVQR